MKRTGLPCPGAWEKMPAMSPELLNPCLKIDLGGVWSLHGHGAKPLPAHVPGCVHTDLEAAGIIPDICYRDNEKDIYWVAENDWSYEREIHIEAAILQRRRQTLRFKGLDTLCSVELNGETVLEADNMFRTWEVDVGKQLRAGRNRLRVHFRSPLPLMQKRLREKFIYSWAQYKEEYLGKSYVRKMACSFGWDWGPMAPTAGIWRPVRLLAWDNRIEDVRVHQQHRDGSVALHCGVQAASPARARARLYFGNDCVATAEGPATPGGTAEPAGSLRMEVPEPHLWWPNGMGDQPLYRLEVELLGPDGGVIDTARRTIGLRRCELVREPDAYGESFRFRVNGRDVFIKGSNWIPCDIYPSRVSTGTYNRLLEAAATAHMNMIRVWGGGIYEDEAFYDACDRLGLLVWQDFMFSCATYPAFDEAFLKSVEAEARDNVRRLRHRACLALWCGNNELEQGLVGWKDGDYSLAMPPEDYCRLFDDLLAKVVAEEDGVVPYWPCSPHTPGPNRAEFNDPTRGDAHAWSVWFGGEPLEAQRKWKYRFMSEFGFQSYPELRTIEAFTLPEERNLINWVMDYHQRSNMGNQTILKYALEWFKEARDFESWLILSQLIQGLCIQFAAEHARRIQGRMDGLMYWQINDMWPGATWSSIDSFGRWKALHYMARRFFAPVLVSLLEDHQTGSVSVHVSNHRPQAFAGRVRWWVTDCAGAILREGFMAADVNSQTNQSLGSFYCTDLREAGGKARLPLEMRSASSIPMAGDRDIIVWAVLEENGCELSRNIALFARPKYLLLRDPAIRAEVTRRDGQLCIDLTTTDCAPWTRISARGTDLRLSDNYLHLAPHLPATVRVEACDITDPRELQDRLVLTPLCRLS